MILITKNKVLINLENIFTVFIIKDTKIININGQNLIFETKEEMEDVFSKIETHLKNTSYDGVIDLTEEKMEN